MFDNNLNPQEISKPVEEEKNEKSEQGSKKSFFTTFTDEELLKIQSGEIDDKYKEKSEEEKEEKIEVFKDNGLFASNNSYFALKTNIERILTTRDYEDKIVNLVDSIISDEQNALNDETKKNIMFQKYVLGLAFTSCRCHGDQQNFLFLMADRLGVRR